MRPLRLFSHLQLLLWPVPLLLCFCCLTCKHAAPANEVVLDTSVDASVAQPIVDAFEKSTGIHVILRSDATGAALIADRAAPRADVWWSGECGRTINLAEAGVLAAYTSPSAAAIHPAYKDSAGKWAGTALRVRVLAVTRIGDGALIAGTVHHLADLTNSAFKGHIALANPLTGVAADHVAAIYVVWGDANAGSFFHALRANDAQVLGSGAAVAEQVGSGAIWAGLCDATDVETAKAAGGKLDAILPDQDGAGTLLTPCTVGLVAGAPHGEQARKLVDYLLSREVEQKLLAAKFASISVFGVEAEPKRMKIDDRELAHKMDAAAREAAAILEGK